MLWRYCDILVIFAFIQNSGCSNETTQTIIDSDNNTVIKSNQTWESQSWKKPFGLGVGPFFLGGSSLKPSAKAIVANLHKKFINYKRLISQVGDYQYYEEYVERDLCVAGCNNTLDYGEQENSDLTPVPGWRQALYKTKAECLAGMCFCQQGRQQLGLCNPQIDDVMRWSDVKYNYPHFRDTFIKGGRTQERDSSVEKRKKWNANYKPLEQSCSSNSIDNHQCNIIDINFICNEGVCQCKNDMRFNYVQYECELYIDVDCTNISTNGFEDGDISRMVNGKMNISGEFPIEDVQQAFCISIDKFAALYVDYYLRPQPIEPSTDLGGGAVTSFFIIAVIVIIVCCCTNCCGKCNLPCRSLRQLKFRQAMEQFSQQMKPQSNPADAQYLPASQSNTVNSQYLPGYAQPLAQSGGYPQTSNIQPGYPQPNNIQAGYPQSSSMQPGYPQTSNMQTGHLLPSNMQPGYPQPSNMQPGYRQPSSMQPGYPQASNMQPGYPQPGYPQQSNMQPDRAQLALPLQSLSEKM